MAAAVAPPPAGPPPEREDPGVPLLRDRETAGLLRDRIERPSRFGLWGLAGLGAATAGIGVALWILERSALGAGLAVLGGVLIALGYVQHRLYRRDLEHWPDEAILWGTGIELVLHNGEVRGISWADPDLALDLVARRAPPPARREYLLVWMSEGRIPSAELSEDGFEAIQRAAVARGLTVVPRRRGSSAEATQTVEIRQSPARRLATLERRRESEGATPATQRS